MNLHFLAFLMRSDRMSLNKKSDRNILTLVSELPILKSFQKYLRPSSIAETFGVFLPWFAVVVTAAATAKAAAQIKINLIDFWFVQF